MKKLLLMKTMLLLCALIVGSSSVWAGTVDDELDQAFTGITGSSYTTFSDKTGTSGAVYAGQCAGGNGSIQLRTTNSNSGVVTTTSGGKVKKVVVDWNSSTADGRTLNIYGKNSAYSAATDLYNASNQGTFLGTIVKGTTTELDIDDDYEFIGFRSNSGAMYLNLVTITWESGEATKVSTPTISGMESFLTSTEVTITCGTDGASIQYSTNAGTSWTDYNAPFTLTETATITAKATKSGLTDSDETSKTFTKITPMTVGEALTAINALADNGTINDQYVSGIVCTAGSLSNGTITYYISDDGTETSRLQVYKGKGLNNDDFEAASDIAVGDAVVVFGQLKKYVKNSTTTPEFNSGNYLISKVSKPAPTFTLDITEKTLDAYTKESVDVTLTTNTDGAITCESNDVDVATVALKSGNVYTITAVAEGTATITIRSAASANYSAANATVAITVSDTRADAGISFASATQEITWGDSFTGQELTNTNSVAVTWSSTDETVATVDNTGAVTVLKAGETDIKATFAGNATYKTAVASYTLTIKKAAAGLSYAQTSFEIMLNDDSFVAPTLVNPNGLTVTYASSNEAVAVVDENTGELVYDATAVGTAKITASFAGNDNFYSGSAYYTINIVDPTIKGSKYNPYTVAEVKNGTATGTGIYVTGFIVGEFKSGGDPITSDFTTDANIAIADEFTDSPTKAASIPVNLTATAHKNTWGNKTNNGKTLGYKVLIKGNKDTYFGVNGIKSVTEVSAVSAPVTVSSAGLATFANDYALDFTNVENLEAYIAKENGTTIELEKVNKVPAGTGVLLRAKNSATDFNVPVTTAAADDVTGNIFVRGTGAAVASTDGDNYNYVLGKHDGVVGFYQAGGMTVAANKAYLQTTVSAARIDVNFDETTAVRGIENGELTIDNGQCFNLAGQRVAQPTKGLYIVNGRKVVIK